MAKANKDKKRKDEASNPTTKAKHLETLEVIAKAA